MPVKYIGYDLLNRYGMIHKFKVPSATLETFLSRIEEGKEQVCFNFSLVDVLLKGREKLFSFNADARKLRVHEGLVELWIE